MDETYIKVSGQWKYPYRALDGSGHTIDFLRTAKRDLAAARRFLERAIERIARSIMGIKSFWSARIIIAGIEIKPMIRKGQMPCPSGSSASAAEQFYGLAF